jgi:HAE1 family hydrophobic/amphiphilic exporter-1
MKLIDLAVERPVSVWVGVILVLLFGVLALLELPIQMRPTVDRPEIRVETEFPGAAAPEIEQQITNKIEEELASVEDMKRLSSTSREGRSVINLEFDWGVDKNIAQLNVQKRLNRVKDLPDDAEEPILEAVSSDEEQHIMWCFARVKPDPPHPFDPLEAYRFADENIKPRFERVSGVGDVWLFGGTEREIRVVIDYQRMSAFQLSVDHIRRVIQRENLNVRGGPLERGKRRETARTVGQFQTPQDLANVIVAYREGRPIYISDFARVEDSFKEQIASVRHGSEDTIVFGIIRRTGTNTLRVIERMEEEIERINGTLLANASFQLQVAYKDSTYIYDAIDNVEVNLGAGAVLATVVLLLFLRSGRSTLIIGLTIPICLIATFIFVNILDRTVNIVSLAGLGFAVGMVVDNAIVVLENCFRHMEEGEERRDAARSATEEVWGAVLSSTLTTMAVFIPIIFLEVEAGQLFKDIAIAIAGAVGMSMVAAITLIPMLSSRWLKVDAKRSENAARPSSIRRFIGWVTFAWVGRLVYGGFQNAAGWILRGTVRKIAIVLAILVPAVLVFLYLAPDLDYLPAGNRNFIFGMVYTPPGRNLEYVKDRSRDIEAIVKEQPETEMYFNVSIIGFRDSSFMGVKVKPEYASPEHMDKFVEELQQKLFFSVPGLRFPPGLVLFKRPIFREAMGGKSVEVNLTGADIAELEAYTERIIGMLQSVEGREPLIPGITQVYSSLDVGNPERRIVPDRERSADLGFNVREVADIVRTLLGGSIVDTYKEGGDEYDITLIGQDRNIRSEDDLENIILHTPTGDRVTLRDLADVVYTVGPTKIEHIDQDRSVTITVRMAEQVALQSVIDQLEEKVVQPLRGEMPTGYTISLYGAADRLRETLEALAPSVILAVLIVYLLMASLFESFVYPFVIMFTVPLSWAGALLGIDALIWLHDFLVANPVYLFGNQLLNGRPEFNVITLLGFVILTGVVVNNAILIVHTALMLHREGMAQNHAIEEAIRRRIRPVFMSTFTSVLGMTPLAVGHGSGAELYTGLGAAVVGGLLLSSIFTLVLTPSAFALFLDLRRGLRKLLRLPPAEDDQIPVVDNV